MARGARGFRVHNGIQISNPPDNGPENPGNSKWYK